MAFLSVIKKKCRVIFLLFVFLLISCQNQQHDSQYQYYQGKHNKYATGFIIDSLSFGYKVSVAKISQGSHNNTLTYYLGTKLPVDSLKANYFQIPVKRVVCMSTTYLPFIKALGYSQSVVGISGARFAVDSVWINSIKSGLIKEVGFEQNLDYETLLDLKPDVVFMYGIGGELSLVVQKLISLGIKPVFIGEYLESHPLAKTEWIKFFGLFYNQLQKSGIIFDTIAFHYTGLAQSTADVHYRPKVLSGFPYKDIWYVSGGNTYFSRFINDAGGTYIFSSLLSDVTPMSLEQVFLSANDADIWINCGDNNSLMQITGYDSRLSVFKPVALKQVFNNNKKISENGGNEYWESGIMNPHLVLRDLITVFHPELSHDTTLYYYKKLK